MFRDVPMKMRNIGELGVEVGDIVEINPDSMLNGGGLALVYRREEYNGLFGVKYLKNGYEVPADDQFDIVRIVSR